jgi:hypothetical protein
MWWAAQALGAFGVLIGFAYIVIQAYMITYRKVSFKQKNHDDYVLRRELEYVLEISESWRKQSFFLFSSFKGSKLRMFFKPAYNFMVLLLISFHAYLGDYVAMKGLLMVIVIAIMLLYMIFFRPF